VLFAVWAKTFLVGMVMVFVNPFDTMFVPKPASMSLTNVILPLPAPSGSLTYSKRLIVLSGMVNWIQFPLTSMLWTPDALRMNPMTLREEMTASVCAQAYCRL